MRKKAVMFMLAMLTLQVVMAGDVITKDINQLPVTARTFISKYFPKVTVSYIKVDKDMFKSKTYDATLSNSTEIEFNGKGEWTEVDCKKKAIPQALIPVEIAKYIQTNYADQKVVKIERDRKGCTVGLANGLDVQFDPYGGFLKLED
ncbi:MAG: PepSY-like domain-containing protein [Bacteroidaceae bacterium]